MPVDHENAAAETADTEDDTGAIVALFAELYHRIIERPDASGHNHGIAIALINDIFMALLATAAGEVWEALLRGSLSNPEKRLQRHYWQLSEGLPVSPLVLGLAVMLGETAAYGDGWAIPCAPTSPLPIWWLA